MMRHRPLSRTVAAALLLAVSRSGAGAQPAAQAPSVRLVRAEAGRVVYVVYEVGSGHYQFRVHGPHEAAARDGGRARER